MVLGLILLSTFLISLISLVGVFTLSLKHKLLDKIVFFLVAFSAGALMGGAFLHLIPESVEQFGNEYILFVYILIGFSFFFLLEKSFFWRHCHKVKCPVHSFAYMNLMGDSLHNFIDGLIIAASFVMDIQIGIITSLAVALHEIPQEIGDFGVLIYGGLSKTKALMLNFVVALTAIIGGVCGFYLSDSIAGMTSFLLPFAAGGFIYIAASDLIPEIKTEKNLRNSMITFGVFAVGVLLMFLVKYIGI